MKIRTHQGIDRALCGEPLEVGEGFARVALTTVPVMGVDERGLVHGGFVFGLADYAAMLAVNHPHVVLGRTEARFLKPVLVGDELVAEGEILERRDNKRLVQVSVFRDSERIFDGEFVCYVLDRHVLDKSTKEGRPE
jgi:acyl-coenzyme A thioesterase PaaI-like protein